MAADNSKVQNSGVANFDHIDMPELAASSDPLRLLASLGAFRPALEELKIKAVTDVLSHHGSPRLAVGVVMADGRPGVLKIDGHSPESTPVESEVLGLYRRLGVLAAKPVTEYIYQSPDGNNVKVLLSERLDGRMLHTFDRTPSLSVSDARWAVVRLCHELRKAHVERPDYIRPLSVWDEIASQVSEGWALIREVPGLSRLVEFEETNVESWIDARARKVLLHGDMTGVNCMILRSGHTALIDPVASEGAPEFDVARLVARFVARGRLDGGRRAVLVEHALRNYPELDREVFAACFLLETIVEIAYCYDSDSHLWAVDYLADAVRRAPRFAAGSSSVSA